VAGGTHPAIDIAPTKTACFHMAGDTSRAGSAILGVVQEMATPPAPGPMTLALLGSPVHGADAVGSAVAGLCRR
jgi:hypothetical protein